MYFGYPTESQVGSVLNQDMLVQKNIQYIHFLGLGSDQGFFDSSKYLSLKERKSYIKMYIQNLK